MDDHSARLLEAMRNEIRQLSAALKRVEARLPTQLATPAEAAALLKVSVPTIRRWIRDEKIAFVRRGRSIRLDLNKLRPLDADEIRAMGHAA